MLQKYDKLKIFLGPKVCKLTLICSLIGVFSFLVETSFVFILQLFLINLGLISKSTSFLPNWVPSSAFFGFIILIIFGLAKALANGGKQYFSIKTQQAFIKKQREYLFSLGLTAGGEISRKELSASFTEIVTQAGSVVLQSSQLIIASVSAILFLVYGATLATKEMLLGFTLLVLLGLPFKKLSKNIKTSGKKLLSDFTLVNESLLLGLKNYFFIKLYNLSPTELAKGNSYLTQYEKNYLSYGKTSSTLASFPIFSGVCIIAALTFVGTQYFQTPGIKLMTFFYVFIRFAQAMSDSFKITSYIRLNYESFKKLYDFSVRVHQSIPTNYSKNSLNNTLNILKGDNLSFSYSEMKIFNELNFELIKEDIFLIKGESGSGKSTLLNVILGLYKPTEGQIFYNDIEGAPKNIADLIGYVGPEPYIIPGTIKENMHYGLHTEKSDEEIWNALRLAHFEETIKNLPKKLEEPLSDAAELSTGQKQRLSIARALLRSPQILVLDEATSNLDPITEKNIVSNIKELSKDMIIIVVSHRDAFDDIATKRLLM